MARNNDKVIEDRDLRLSKYLNETSKCSCKSTSDHKAKLETQIPEERGLDKLASIFKALSVTKRLEILFLLKNGISKCICELESVLEVSQPTITHHIRILQRAGIIESKRESRWLLSTIKDKKVMDIVDSLLQNLENN
ncbi:MAG: ArsR/SmtB family transcription factor [Candidatus Hodarchaeales archaeon]